MSSRMIQVVSNTGLPSFLGLCDTPSHMNTTSSLYLIRKAHSGCFHILSAVNDVACHCLWSIYSMSSIMPRFFPLIYLILFKFQNNIHGLYIVYFHFTDAQRWIWFFFSELETGFQNRSSHPNPQQFPQLPATVQHSVDLFSFSLVQGASHGFCKGPETKYFSHYEPY